jgi:hypothetical protein
MWPPVCGRLGEARVQVWPKRDLCRADRTETTGAADFCAEIGPEFVQIPDQ